MNLYFGTCVFLRCFQSRFSAGVALRLRSRALRVVEGWIRLSFDPPSNSLPGREGGLACPLSLALACPAELPARPSPDWIGTPGAKRGLGCGRARPTPRRPRADVMAGGTWTATGVPAESVRTYTTRGALSGLIPPYPPERNTLDLVMPTHPRARAPTHPRAQRAPPSLAGREDRPVPSPWPWRAPRSFLRDQVPIGSGRPELPTLPSLMEGTEGR